MIKPDTDIYSVVLDSQEKTFEIMVIDARHISLNHHNQMVNPQLIESVSEIALYHSPYDNVIALSELPDKLTVKVAELNKEYYVFTLKMASGAVIQWQFKTYADALEVFNTLRCSA